MFARRLLMLALTMFVFAGCNRQQAATPMDRAQAFFRAGEWDQAITACRESAAANPQSPLPHTIAGRSFAGKGDWDSAISEYNEAIRIAPDDPEAFHNRGIAYREKKENQLASDDFRHARELDPSYSKAYLYSPKNDLATTPSLNAKEASAAAIAHEDGEDDGMNLYTPESPASATGSSTKTASRVEAKRSHDEGLSDRELRDRLNAKLDKRTQTEKMFGPIETGLEPKAKPRRKAPARYARLDDSPESPADDETPAQPQRRTSAKQRRPRTPSIGQLNAQALREQRAATSGYNFGFAAPESVGQSYGVEPAPSANPYSGITVGPFSQPRIRSTGQQSYSDAFDSRINSGNRPYTGLPHLDPAADPVYTPAVPPVVIPNP